MLNSLRLYTTYFLKSSVSEGRKFILHDVDRYLLRKRIFRQNKSAETEEIKASLDKAVKWLITSQKANSDGGMGSYHLVNGWSTSYPETTGYIIPTLLVYGKKFSDDEAVNSALKAAGFLLDIQKPSGGWQGGRMKDDRPEIVFNTGQVLRGMIAAYEFTAESKYLDAAVKAGKWLAGIQHADGYWKSYALMNQHRVYDTFVDAPLLDLYRVTKDETFKSTALRNLEWVTNNKMTVNGWFEDCDNTVRRNDRPILHTIAYTLDGLIDSGIILSEEKYIKAALPAARFLRDEFISRGFLHGRFNSNWQGSEFMICTGCAQVSIIWRKLYKATGDAIYLDASERMNNLLIRIQSRSFEEKNDTLGAIPGSFPLWGRYEPFAFPNWATKFFADTLMLDLEERL